MLYATSSDTCHMDGIDVIHVSFAKKKKKDKYMYMEIK